MLSIEEKNQFFALLDEASDAIDKPRKPLNAKILMLRLVEHWGFKNLMNAVHAHLLDPERGMYSITPAHIEEQIKKAIEKDGRPAADEAWTIALALDDESATVVTNDEISQAWAVAREAMPDKTAARMAFRAVYERLCAEARKQHKKPNWFPSLGFDVEQRAHVLQSAAEKGLLKQEQQQQLTHEALKIETLLLSAKHSNSDKAREAIEALKQMLKNNTQKLAASGDE